MTKRLLHLEGLLVLLGSIYFFAYYELNWLLFFILLFIPDLSMIGYLFHKRIGAVVYNIFHTYIFSAILITVGLLFANIIFIELGVIWAAHIGMDRFFGFGLKYPSDFKDTHLQRV